MFNVELGMVDSHGNIPEQMHPYWHGNRGWTLLPLRTSA